MPDNYLLVKGANGYTVKVKLVELADGTFAVKSDAQLTGSTVAQKASASQTRPSNATAYAANQVVGQNPAANMVFATNLPAGNGFVILSAHLRIDRNAIPAGMGSFRLHLYDAAPTAIVDGAAYNLPSGDRSKYLGHVTLFSPTLLGDTIILQATDVNLVGKLAAGSSSIWGINTTLSAFTPTAQAVKTVTLNVVAL